MQGVAAPRNGEQMPASPFDASNAAIPDSQRKQGSHQVTHEVYSQTPALGTPYKKLLPLDEMSYNIQNG